MKDILPAMMKHWLFAATFAAIGVAGALGVHLAYNQIQAEAQLIPRALEKVKSAQVPWGQEPDEEVKNISLWLKSYDFMRDFLNTNCGDGQRAAYCSEFGDSEMAPLALMKAVDSQIEDNRLLRIRVRTEEAASAAALANGLAEHIAAHNQSRALQEAQQFAQQLKGKKEDLEGQIKHSLDVLAKISGTGFGPTLSQDPGQHLSFLGGVQAKVSDVDLQLAENRKQIEVLRAAAGDANYGPGLRIAELERENATLVEKRKAILGQLRRGLSDSYLTSAGSENLTRLKEEFRSAADNYAQVVRALDRLQLSASFTQGPVEFFQRASPQLAHYRWPLSLLIGFGLFLSQVFAVSVFLIFRMWETEEERSLELQAGYI